MKPSEFIREYRDRIESSNPTDTITVDVPLFIRLLEYAREDAKTDMDLHDLTERITKLAASGETLTMANYDSIAPQQEQPMSEDASCGATASGAVATSMGGGAGFGKSIFMRRNPKTKKSK